MPLSIAPFEAIVIQADKKNEEVLRVSEEIYNFIKNKGIDVALDDRAESPGIKFKDA